MAVPGRDLFSLKDVTTEIYNDTNGGRNLLSCFADSDAAQFDPYYGSKTMNPKTLLGFKNYGHNYYYLYGNSALYGYNIAPVGCHIPSLTEIRTLINYLGGNSIAGGKLKETGTTHWNSPNSGATNETGFTAIGAGVVSGGQLGNINYYNTLWFYGNSSIDNENILSLSYNSNIATIDYRESFDLNGYPYMHSVRCIKDNTDTYPSIYDGDGNLYQTVLIGNQRWLTEDLHTSRYNDGMLIEPEYYTRYYKQFFA